MIWTSCSTFRRKLQLAAGRRAEEERADGKRTRVRDARGRDPDRLAAGRGRDAGVAAAARCCAPARPSSRSASATMSHWFDGLAMLHRFGFADGEVSYANRFLESKAYRAAAETGEITLLGVRHRSLPLAVQARDGAVSAEADRQRNVNLVKLGERFVAMTETPIPVEFDPETLAAAGVAWKVPGELTTAHPHLDRASGGMLNYAAKLGPRNQLPLLPARAGRRRRSRGRRLAADQASPPTCTRSASPSAGSCSPSSRYVVNPLRLALSGRPYIENYRWKPELGTRFTLIDRQRRRGARAVRDRGVLRLPPRQRLRGRRRDGRRRHLHVRRRRDRREPLPRQPPRRRARSRRRR